MFHWPSFEKSTLEAMFRKKCLADAMDRPDVGDDPTETSSTTALKRSLTAVDLVLYGVGSSVGAGIFVLVGLGAKIAGPSIAISFLGCGMACILTSLAYSEFASLIPVSGSAFTYISCGMEFDFGIWVYSISRCPGVGRLHGRLFDKDDRAGLDHVDDRIPIFGDGSGLHMFSPLNCYHRNFDSSVITWCQGQFDIQQSHDSVSCLKLLDARRIR
jgi:hypothetical protein